MSATRIEKMLLKQWFLEQANAIAGMLQEQSGILQHLRTRTAERGVNDLSNDSHHHDSDFNDSLHVQQTDPCGILHKAFIQTPGIASSAHGRCGTKGSRAVQSNQLLYLGFSGQPRHFHDQRPTVS